MTITQAIVQLSEKLSLTHRQADTVFRKQQTQTAIQIHKEMMFEEGGEEATCATCADKDKVCVI